jgi:hypothetical protein
MFMIPMPPTEQRDRGDRSEQVLHHARAALARLVDVAHVAHVEVGRLVGRRAMAAAQQRLDLAQRLGHRLGAARLHEDRVHEAGELGLDAERVRRAGVDRVRRGVCATVGAATPSTFRSAVLNGIITTSS